MNFIHREFDFLEDVQHFAAHITRGPDDGDAIAHLCLSFIERTVPLRPAGTGRKARALAALRKIHWNLARPGLEDAQDVPNQTLREAAA